MALLEDNGRGGKWFDGPTHKAVETANGIEFATMYKTDNPVPFLVSRDVPFKPKPKTELDQVLDEVKAHAGNIDEIVILYRTKDREVTCVSNQGDTAGALFFVEKAKLQLLKDEEVPPGPKVG